MFTHTRKYYLIIISSSSSINNNNTNKKIQKSHNITRGKQHWDSLHDQQFFLLALVKCSVSMQA